MSGWRYIAQRATTGEFLDLDLPLNRDELSWALSGPGSLRATIQPDLGALRASDGSLILDEWGTLLYAEASGIIRWGGIVVKSDFADEQWQVEASGLLTYPHGIPFLGTYSKIEVDPADVARYLWEYVYTQAGAPSLLPTITDTATPTRLGTPEVPAYDEVFVDGKWQRKDKVNPSKVIPSAKADLAEGMTATSTSFKIAKIDNFARIPLPFNVTIGSETLTVRDRDGLVMSNLVRGVGNSSPAAHNKGVDVNYTGTQSRRVEKVEAEPYALNWWEAKDVGEEIEQVCKEAGIEFVEEHFWEGSGIGHRIRMGYPRLGRRREDLAFEQGVNVTEVVSVSRDGDSYANEVIGIGAGEGAKSLRRSLPTVKEGRLRRPYVYTDKGVSSASRMDALIRRELAWRRKTLDITSVTVRDHPHAPLASWALGDDVLIRAEIPWVGDVSLWCRVTGWALVEEHTARLNLTRSDSFDYGG